MFWGIKQRVHSYDQQRKESLSGGKGKISNRKIGSCSALKKSFEQEESGENRVNRRWEI